MITLNVFYPYSGALILALIFLYGLKNYSITLIAGFAAFFIFYFSFFIKNFEWNFEAILFQLKDAAIVYIIAFVLAAIIYRVLPAKHNEEAALK